MPVLLQMKAGKVKLLDKGDRFWIISSFSSRRNRILPLLRVTASQEHPAILFCNDQRKPNPLSAGQPDRLNKGSVGGERYNVTPEDIT